MGMPDDFLPQKGDETVVETDNQDQQTIGSNLVPIGDLKHLGTYSKNELPEIRRLILELTSAFDFAKLELLNFQKITVKTQGHGEATLTSEPRSDYQLIKGTSQLFFLHDWILFVCDIALYFWKEENPKRVTDLISDPLHWIKELYNHDDEYIYLPISDRARFSKFISEVYQQVLDRAQATEDEVEEKTEPEVSQGAVAPGSEKLEELVVASRAGQSQRSSETEGDGGEDQATTADERQNQIRELLRDDYIEAQKLMRQLQFEALDRYLPEELVGGLGLETIIEQFRSELYSEFFLYLQSVDPELIEQLRGVSGADKISAQRALIRQFLESPRGMALIHQKLPSLLATAIRKLRETEQIDKASELLEKITNDPSLEAATIKLVAKAQAQTQPTPRPQELETPPSGIDKSQITSNSDLAGKAEKLLVAQLSLHLDPAESFRLRSQIQAQAQAFVGRLQPEQIRLLAIDPKYAEQISQDFIAVIARTANFTASITDPSATEASVLTRELKTILKVDSPIVTTNVLETLESIAVSFGVSIAEDGSIVGGGVAFINSLSTEHLELIFNISLKNASTEDVIALRNVLTKHLLVAKSSLALTDLTGVTEGGLSGLSEEQEQNLQRISEIRKVSAQRMILAVNPSEGAEQNTEISPQEKAAVFGLQERLRRSIVAVALENNEINAEQFSQISNLLTSLEERNQADVWTVAGLVNAAKQGQELPQTAAEIVPSQMAELASQGQATTHEPGGAFAPSETSAISKATQTASAAKEIGKSIKDIATQGWAGVIKTGARMLRSKGGRRTLATMAAVGGGLGAAAIGRVIYGLSTPVGAILAPALGWAGSVAIPVVGGPLGFMAGAEIGARLSGGSQWTSAFGWAPKNPSYSQALGLGNESAALGPSLRDLRSETSGSAAAQTSQTSTLTSQTASSQPLLQGPAPAAVVNSGASGSALAEFLTAGTAVIAATAAPLIGILGIGLLSMHVLFTIYSAFLISVPSDGVGPKTSYEQSKYAVISKTATPNRFENTDIVGPSSSSVPRYTNGKVSYSISVKPKQNYQIAVTNVTDEFTSFSGDVGENVRIEKTPAPNEVIDALSFLLSEKSTSERSTTYEYLPSGKNLEDSLFINNVVVTFDVYDQENNLVASNQTLKGSATVTIGKPRIGCWPASGAITQLPFGEPGTSHREFNSDAYDIAGPLGTPIRAPFPGNLVGGSDPNGYGEYGKLTVAGVGTLYFGHMKEHPENGSISAGDIIGYMANTGNSTGPHLHYELKNAQGGLSLDDIIAKTGTMKIGDTVSSCDYGE